MESVWVLFLGVCLGSAATIAGAVLLKYLNRKQPVITRDDPPTRNDVPPSPTELAFIHTPDREVNSVAQYKLWQSLTARENQVALLVARGLANAEVAATLQISPRTVDAYLRSVYNKLDVRSRTELANFVRDLED